MCAEGAGGALGDWGIWPGRGVGLAPAFILGVQGVVVMSDGERLQHLASLVGQRNSLDARIAEALGRPALSGHFGEYVASIVFGIELHSSAAQRGSDGVFTSGVLTGRRVEIKYYPLNEGLLDLKVDGGPDFYLVMTGPRKAAGSSRGGGAAVVDRGGLSFRWCGSGGEAAGAGAKDRDGYQCPAGALGGS